MLGFELLYFLYRISVLFYPRATRCDGDIVTLLWFRVSVVRPCMDPVDTIETKLLRVSLSNLADKLTMMTG